VAIADWINEPEAQLDCVQETFLRALRSLESLRDSSRFRPWLLQIARNTARDLGRSRSRRRWEPLEPENEPEALEPEAFDYVELADTARQLNAALATLSPRDATALDLVVHLGFGPAEVATALGISPNNAKVVVHRARRRLQTALEMQRQMGG
ncbi:MAG: sigma-70 family RNA polymerase sigma factor, partial [Acidimicrobiales bacterium]|nr:sigma-70 family RNA polymerase sigma factor [Acidimicrobiales bacterium]